jgi:uncharacterized protein
VGGRPFVVGVTDLVRRPGTRRTVHRAERFDGLAVSTAEVEPGGEVVADLELESISNGIVASGSITVPWTGACRRCLEPVHDVTVTAVREVFERHPTEGETYPLGDDTVDLQPMVRDAVLLALPLAPLCTAGCPGPDPGGFPAVVVDDDGDDGPDGEPDAGGDPRWAALDQLRFE